MTGNMKNPGFLEDLTQVLKRHATKLRTHAPGLREPGFSNRANSHKPILSEPEPPSVSESLLGLLAHLVDLEHRIQKAEQHGDLVPLSHFGEVIRAARKRQGLTVEALADLAGVGPVTVHKLEKGSLQVQVPKLTQVAEALGLDLLVTAR